ncbi:MAG: hypothetical protein NVSMB29_04120 [Candidatus Dormibacteria bacterium]
MASAPETPLTRKLGIREGQAIALLGAPPGWGVAGLPDGVRVRRRLQGQLDLVLIFIDHLAQLSRRLPAVRAALRPAGCLWVAWPRRAGGHRSAVTENDLRRLLLPTGLVDTKVAALDVNWSALRFVVRRELR